MMTTFYDDIEQSLICYLRISNHSIVKVFITIIITIMILLMTNAVELSIMILPENVRLHTVSYCFSWQLLIIHASHPRLLETITIGNGSLHAITSFEGFSSSVAKKTTR